MPVSASRQIALPVIVVMLAAVAMLWGSPGGLGERVAEISIDEPAGIIGSYLTAPLSFERNDGQIAEEARFLARGTGYDLFLTDTGPVLAAISEDGTDALHMNLVGANAAPAISGIDQLSGSVNYFIGADPALWRTDVQTYERVLYSDVYPGIDLVFYGNPGQLEYDFVVAPGASPDVIRLQFEGAETLSLDAGGRLVAAVGESEFVLSAPIVYQEIAGERMGVTGSYILSGDEVSFEIGAYDASLPLVIDPILTFASYLGGALGEKGFGVATDGDGNVYVTGETESLDFPVTAGVLSEDIAGDVNQQDVFVTKISADGDDVLYSTYLGGTGNNEIGFDIEVDAEGQAFIAGRTDSDDFPLTPGAFNTDAGTSGFVAKLSADGSEVLYATKLGTNTDAYGIEIDGDGQAYVAGFDLQNFFDATAGAFQEQGNGNGDAIVAVLNEDGTDLVWGSYIGGSMRDKAFDIARDSDGYVYLTGYTPSEDFPTVNALQDTKGAAWDAFVAKFMPDGSGLMYSTYLGGDGGGLSDQGYGIDADDDGNAYVTGFTGSDDFPISGNAFQGSLGSGQDAFVTKLGPNGNMVYSTFLGGNNVDHGAGIDVDAQGNAHVAGFTFSTNFPTEDAFQASQAGSADAFAAKLNAGGSALIYSTYLGGDATDRSGNGGDNDAGGVISVDETGNAYVVGFTDSTDFPTMDPFQPNNAGGSDAFVVKLLGEGFVWGDVDCDAGLGSVDGLKNLRHVAGLVVSQTEPCADIGSEVQIIEVASVGVGVIWGDVDCDGAVTSVDALKQLRHIAALGVSQTEPCPDLGAIIQVLP